MRYNQKDAAILFAASFNHYFFEVPYLDATIGGSPETCDKRLNDMNRSAFFILLIHV